MGYVIITRYHGPTNYRGSRVIATGPAPTADAARAARYSRAIVGWDHTENGPENHRRAALAVVQQLCNAGWSVYLDDHDYGATLPDDSGRVFILRYR